MVAQADLPVDGKSRPDVMADDGTWEGEDGNTYWQDKEGNTFIWDPDAEDWVAWEDEAEGGEAEGT